jgi:hypothetical protein
MRRVTTSIIAVVMALSATAAFGEGKVAVRQERQQQRIAQGVKSGSLTAAGTAHLENREAAINRQVRADRAVNQRQNRVSKRHFSRTSTNGIHQQR